MVDKYVAALGEGIQVKPDRPLLSALFEEYERVLMQSLVSSFGLDFLITDRHGGDVDTVHNVRQIDSDPEMVYKNRQNKADYDNRGAYNSHEYHHHAEYISRNREVSKQKKAGTLRDAYTGELIKANGKSDLDHVMAASEIHNDRGRVLAGMNGADLANIQENLQPTNPHTNRSKKQKSMDEYLAAHADEYTDAQIANMKSKDAAARNAIDSKINHTYYASKRFRKDVVAAAGAVSAAMGARQALGLVFAELWFAVKDEFQSAKSTFGEWLTAIGNALKKGFERIKENYKTLFSTCLKGAIGGALSSIVTTICNIFFTTAKTAVTCIRQAWASIVDAVEILILNPDNCRMGDRLRAVLKVLATGASVVVGVLAGEAVSKTGIQLIPAVGDIVPSFVSAFATGILSCTLLYVLDRSRFMNQCFEWINSLPTVENDLWYFRKQATYFEQYAAQLAGLDIKRFADEVHGYEQIVNRLETCTSVQELNSLLAGALADAGVEMPWEGNFEEFMGDRQKKLRFS